MPPISLASLAVAFFLLGCDATTNANARPSHAADSAASFVPYTGPMRVLFDDGIDPDVFSPVPDATLSTADRRISERIRASAFVVNVRVVTVTAEHVEQNGRIELELLPMERPIHGDLAGFVSSGEPIKVHLGPTSSGYSQVRAGQGELVGKRMNLCWARFEDGGEAAEHWHALSDNPKTKLTIAKAAAIVNFE